MFDLNTPILIVDDLETMRKVVRNSCRKMGFKNFVEAADGKLGWEALNSASPPIGLIISDWNMPNCTGIDLLKRVRADSRFGGLAFLLLTAVAEKDQVLEARREKVSAYVVKPFNAFTLKEKLEEAYKSLKSTS